MKKIKLITFCMLAATMGFGQDKSSMSPGSRDSLSPAIHIFKEARFLVNVHKAYSVGMGSTFKFFPDDVSTIEVTQNGNGTPVKTINYANPTKGLGDGFKFGFGGSYILNDFINIGLDFDYFNSTIKKYRDSTFHQTNIPVRNNGADEYVYREHNTTSYKATLLSITPNVTFKAISRPKWFMYNKLGAIITFRPNSLQEDMTETTTSMGWQGFLKDSASVTIKKYEWSIRNPAFGFIAALGVQLKLAEKLRGFAELQFSHTVFVIRKRTLTDYVVDNKHLENTFPIGMRELQFVRSFSSRNSNANDLSQPSQTIIQRIPITYIGLQVGLAYQL